MAALERIIYFFQKKLHYTFIVSFVDVINIINYSNFPVSIHEENSIFDVSVDSKKLDDKFDENIALEQFAFNLKNIIMQFDQNVCVINQLN